MYYDYGDGYVEDVAATTKWTIKDFCLNCKNGVRCFYSPTFFANSLRWKLRLYPVSVEDVNYAAISLTMYTHAEVTIKYELSVVDDDNKKHNTMSEPHVFFHQKSSRMCSRFIKQEELTNKKNRLLANGALTILCEIRADPEAYSSDDETDARLLLLQGAKRARTLENFGDFEQFLLNQKYCDVKFVVGDKKLPAHKVVLASRSAVFAAMFDERHQVIDVTDVDYKVFVEMLRFAYTRTTGDIKDMAKPLFVAANKYGLDDLTSLCADALVRELSESNAIEYLSLADRYGLQNLRVKALDFVASNVDGLKNVAAK